jgi:hypothetical protein
MELAQNREIFFRAKNIISRSCPIEGALVESGKNNSSMN